MGDIVAKFEPGHAKLGGRQAGTPNKVPRTFERKCEEAGIDFFEELIKIASDPEHKDYFNAVKEGCQYIEPKKKAIEMSGSINQGLVQKAQEYEAMNKEELIAIIQNELKCIK